MTDILLFILCPSAGYVLIMALTKPYKNKENFWQTLYNYAKQLENNVKFGKTNINDFTEEFCCKNNNTATELIKQCINDFSLNGNIKVSGYSKDNEFLQQFFLGLFAPNSQALLEHLSTYIEMLEEKWKQQRAVNQKTLPVYPKLGLLAGIALALILM